MTFHRLIDWLVVQSLLVCLIYSNEPWHHRLTTHWHDDEKEEENNYDNRLGITDNSLLVYRMQSATNWEVSLLCERTAIFNTTLPAVLSSIVNCARTNTGTCPTNIPDRCKVWVRFGPLSPAGATTPVPSAGCIPRKSITAATPSSNFLNCNANFARTSPSVPICSQDRRKSPRLTWG